MQRDLVDIKRNRYALVTGAYNEEHYIEKTIISVVTQRRLPVCWVIVDDASSDRTPDIVEQYSHKMPYIRLQRLTKHHARDFRAHVLAINAGYDQLADEEFDFIGNLDADISFGSDYFERLLENFQEDPRLGIGGGFLYEEQGDEYRARRFNNEGSVPNAVQLFRRQCYESIGRYKALKYGAPDWCAEVEARMKGWRVRSFPELRVYHHRHTGTAGGQLRNMFRDGLVAYSLGSDPYFEIIKCIRRALARPRIFGAIWRLAGFISGYTRSEPRLVNTDFMTFLREDQRRRILTFLGSRRHLNDSESTKR